MKKIIFFFFSLVVIFNFSPQAKAFFDPTVSGCVFQKHTNAKIRCVSYKFNERKRPGSFKKAESDCYRELNYLGRKYGEHGYWIDGCLSSAGQYHGQHPGR